MLHNEELAQLLYELHDLRPGAGLVLEKLDSLLELGLQQQSQNFVQNKAYNEVIQPWEENLPGSASHS